MFYRMHLTTYCLTNWVMGKSVWLGISLVHPQPRAMACPIVPTVLLSINSQAHRGERTASKAPLVLLFKWDDALGTSPCERFLKKAWQAGRRFPENISQRDGLIPRLTVCPYPLILLSLIVNVLQEPLTSCPLIMTAVLGFSCVYFHSPVSLC